MTTEPNEMEERKKIEVKKEEEKHTKYILVAVSVCCGVLLLLLPFDYLLSPFTRIETTTTIERGVAVNIGAAATILSACVPGLLHTWSTWRFSSNEILSVVFCRQYRLRNSHRR